MSRSTLLFVFVFTTIALASVFAESGCAGSITEPGILKSPGPVEVYPYPDSDVEVSDSVKCVWHLEAPKNKRVVLKITQVTLDNASHSGSCTEDDDHIAIFDGLSRDAEKRLAIICNRRNSTLAFRSTADKMLVLYKVDNLRNNGSFISEVTFTYPESDKCGGNMNLMPNESYTLKSPQISLQEGINLDCQWNIIAPSGMVIVVSFYEFQILPCQNGHFVEVKDGILPDSLLIASFCGDSPRPSSITSSSNKMSIRLISNAPFHFAAKLFLLPETCNSSLKYVGNREAAYFTSPGYGTVPLTRAINCGSEFQSSSTYLPTLIRIKNIDILPGSAAGKCDRDKLIISTRTSDRFSGKDYEIINGGANYLFNVAKLSSVYDGDVYPALQYEFCGSHGLVEFYFPGTVFLNLITNTQYVSETYKGVEVEILYKTFCGRNYTEPYGRIMNGPDQYATEDCNTLISAPEGYTIALYFISFEPSVINNLNYLDIYDGETTHSKIIESTKESNHSVYDIINPIFSTSNRLLIQNHKTRNSQTNFDSNYMITNKGRGCGGYMFADQGVLTSPLYPETYRENKSCEWELETPVATRLRIRFEDFDLGNDCVNNFVQLINREGKVISTHCSETPEAFTSEENYIKIVSATSRSNNGKGWHALFAGVM